MFEALRAAAKHRWLGPYVREKVARRWREEATGERHLLVALCDHFEPMHGSVSPARGRARVETWRRGYPRLAAEFADDDGRPPRHSFFFPGEQYDVDLIEPLAELCELGLGEVEVHLHHDGDTRDTLRVSLEQTLADLGAHGLVPHKDGRPQWAFIHGNWCLANARPDGRWCGVDDELELLYELGCYADFTFPSAPDVCQPPFGNIIWYPKGDVRRRRAHEDAERIEVGTPRRDRLMLFSGPLALTKRPDGWRPRLEASALTARDPATASRLASWIDCHVHIPGRPEWAFLKLHTHGAPDREAESLLGAPQRAFHRELAYLRQQGWKLHYVTAREMYNMARAAMDGRIGQPCAFRDYEIAPPPRALKSRATRAAG